MTNSTCYVILTSRSVQHSSAHNCKMVKQREKKERSQSSFLFLFFQAFPKNNQYHLHLFGRHSLFTFLLDRYLSMTICSSLILLYLCQKFGHIPDELFIFLDYESVCYLPLINYYHRDNVFGVIFHY